MNVILLILPISRDDKIFVKESFLLGAEQGTSAATFQKMMGMTITKEIRSLMEVQISMSVNKALNFGASLIIGCSFLSFPTRRSSDL